MNCSTIHPYHILSTVRKLYLNVEHLISSSVNDIHPFSLYLSSDQVATIQLLLLVTNATGLVIQLKVFQSNHRTTTEKMIGPFIQKFHRYQNRQEFQLSHLEKRKPNLKLQTVYQENLDNNFSYAFRFQKNI